MKAHLTAIKSRLEQTTGKPWHIGNAVAGQTYPYGIISAAGWGDDSEPVLCGTSTTLDTPFRVKAVGVTANDVYTLLSAARAALSPDLSWTPLTVVGRRAQTKYVRSEFVAADTSVSLTQGGNPTQGVDTYRLESQPVAVTP